MYEKNIFFFTFQMEDFVFLEDARDEYSFAALKHKIPQVRCFTYQVVYHQQ